MAFMVTFAGLLLQKRHEYVIPPAKLLFILIDIINDHLPRIYVHVQVSDAQIMICSCSYISTYKYNIRRLRESLI